MHIVFVGIDLAKNVFALHSQDEAGKPAPVHPVVRRDQLLEVVAQLPPCTIGMEACSGAQHQARQCMAFGHTVRLMAAKFVLPCRMSGKRGKNDAAGSAAICEAMQRPSMRFVQLKTELAQSRLAIHTARQGWVEARTVCINRLRSLLSEFGVVLPLKAQTVRTRAAEALDGFGPPRPAAPSRTDTTSWDINQVATAVHLRRFDPYQRRTAGTEMTHSSGKASHRRH